MSEYRMPDMVSGRGGKVVGTAFFLLMVLIGLNVLYNLNWHYETYPNNLDYEVSVQWYDQRGEELAVIPYFDQVIFTFKYDNQYRYDLLREYYRDSSMQNMSAFIVDRFTENNTEDREYIFSLDIDDRVLLKIIRYDRFSAANVYNVVFMRVVLR